MDELVSIIMPSFNTSSYINKSIESVICQTYTNWELIIVDDCSTDNTEEIVKRYLIDDRIKFIQNEKNYGAAVSRNIALREAKGRWIAFLDSDDLWSSDKLKKQLFFMKNNGYHFSYTNYSEIDTNGNQKGIMITGPHKITKQGFYNYCWPGCLTVMYDSKYIGVIQVPNIQKNNDYAMWLKVCKKANCYLLNENLAFYRRGRDGSISTHNIKTMIKWHYKLFRTVENQNIFRACISTVRNIIFGVLKKVFYVRRKNENITY